MYNRKTIQDILAVCCHILKLHIHLSIYSVLCCKCLTARCQLCNTWSFFLSHEIFFFSKEIKKSPSFFNDVANLSLFRTSLLFISSQVNLPLSIWINLPMMLLTGNQAYKDNFGYQISYSHKMEIRPRMSHSNPWWFWTILHLAGLTVMSLPSNLSASHCLRATVTVPPPGTSSLQTKDSNPY